MQPTIYMAGGFEDIIPVIVIFGVLISKIVQASRKAKKEGGDLEPEASPERPAGADELRKFLETITGTTTKPDVPPTRPVRQEAPATRVAPVPPPPPVAVPRPAKVLATPQRSPRIKNPSKTHAHGAPVQKKYNWDHRPSNKSNGLVDPLAIGRDLVNRQSLAKAVVLREILGPPLGLQE